MLIGTSSNLFARGLVRGVFSTALALLLGLGPWSTHAPQASVEIDLVRAEVAQASLDSATRETVIETLDAAETSDWEAASLSKRVDELRAEHASLPKRIEDLQKALQLDREQALHSWSRRLPTDADGETMERLLEQQQRSVAELQAQIDAVEVELTVSLTKPLQAASDIATLRRRVEDMATPPVAEPGGERDLLLKAQQLRHASELRRAKAELDLRVLEQDSAALRQRQQELSLRELRQRLSLDQRRTEILQERIADLWRTELQARIEQLAQTESELKDSVPVVTLAAAENTELGTELVDNHEELSRDRRELSSIEEERDYVTEALRDSRARLDLGGATESVGRWMWTERRRLEPRARLRQELASTRIELADLRLRLVTLNDQQQQLADMPRALLTLREASDAEVDDELSDAVSDDQLPMLLDERVELLGLLEPVLTRRIAALQQSETALHERLKATEALQSLLDRHLLWLPSHSVVESHWLTRVPQGLRDLAMPSRFATTLKLTVRSMGERPWLWVTCLMVMLVLVALRLQAPSHIRKQAALVDRPRIPNYRATGVAFLWTVLGALPIPVTIGLLGLLLQQLGNPGRYSDSLGRACVTLVVPLTAVQLLRWSLMKDGLAEAHFGWNKRRRKTLARLVPITAIIVLPLHYITTLAFIRRSDIAIDVQARLAVVTSTLVLAWAFWHLLKAGRVWGTRLNSSALHWLLRTVLPLLLLANAALALSGYIYSSGVLLKSLLDSINLIIAVTLGLGMLERWFLVGKQRLALRQLEASQAAAREKAANTTETVVIPDDDISVQEVDTQTASFLRGLRISVLTLGLLWVWMEVLPAIYRLDEVALWHFSHVGPNGSPIESPVTLASVLLGIFALVVTVLGSRNLPGLVEISLLSRAGVDAASRYMITSLLRYAIVIGGTLIGFSLLGMRWSQLQWMAAALTVGLGFGLQEIFANFVSGIILLFERPFRVGDVITVGDMNGRVTRIRTRATTILDFDNKEIVMPNKTFITGHLTNWGLSDTTTRVTLKVGVAYGTNPEAARQLLLQAAAEDPRVLDDPAPCCWFLQFGASSLDFELRVFVASLSDRLESQNALNMRINELFHEHGIEIAFPQLDLHVRDMPPSNPGAKPA
ncbi:Mechanosensitive channel MscK [Halioglobus japonicus]|nr:Mechanosensitive channel MscK [Halioglobus japonicus]